VEVKKRFDPRYPKSAKDMNLGDQRCLAKVFIDESGAPYKVLVENCPKVFHAETQAAIMKWRWYPPKVGREKVKAQITIAINYKVR
jgi:outer membrane biosynthesis protein TonB